MTSLPHSLDRTVLICAPRGIVFRYFTDSERFARWWGPGSTIDGKVGGEVKIVYPNQAIARGVVTAIEADHSITFTYGYDDPSKHIPPGGSVVTITLQDHADGTLLQLRHQLPTEVDRDQHVPGWRFQLAQFANRVANELHAAVAGMADQWFAAWAETDAAARDRLLLACTTDDVRMQDAYSCLAGRSELSQHIGMCHLFMPGVVTKREGDPKHCQGTALVEWTASDTAGNPRGKGTNVVSLAADGRITSVVGFW
jgi:uncharacterized protein YndB with AHSA1/START domain